MRLQDLLEQAEAPPDVLDAVAELVALKARTRELGAGAIPPAIHAFVVTELTAPGLEGTGERRLGLDRARAVASDVFRTAVDRFT